MSATRPSGPTSARPRAAAQRETPQERAVPRELSGLRARRREANRRRRLLRLDLGIGVFAALVLLIGTPGLAIAALFAGLLLLACGVSIGIERRRRRPTPASQAGLAGRGRALQAGTGRSSARLEDEDGGFA